MTYTVSIDFAEAEGFYNMGCAAAPFRGGLQYGRFECHDPSADAPEEWDSVADRLIASPVFDDGSLLWCDTYVEALLLAKVHRAAGYTAYLLWDMAENPPGTTAGHCVLTSWDLMGDRT